MNQDNVFLAGVLSQGSRALAGYATRDLLEKYPDSKKGFEPDPFAGWQNWLATRIEELAAAIAVNRPSLFISQVEWSTIILQSRGILPDIFRNGLEFLCEVLADELPKQVRDLAIDYVNEALEAFDDSSIELSTRLLPDTEMGRLASTYLLVLLEGDRQRASRLILDALDHDHSVRSLYLQVLLPAQEELGRMWALNEINVAEEHFASQTTKMLMTRLLDRTPLKPSNGKTMLAAAVAGNQHDIGLQAVADFFEMDGWRTISLGANVPIRDLVEAVDCFNAHLIGLSVALPTQLDTVKKTIQAVRDGIRGKEVKVLIGGCALINSDNLPQELGADGFAVDPAEAVSLGRQLVGLD